MLKACDCSPNCNGTLVYATDETVVDAPQWAALDERIVKLLSYQRCARCRIPTPDEYVDPYWYEAGERICDPCGLTDRPGPRPHRKKAAA